MSRLDSMEETVKNLLLAVDTFLALSVNMMINSPNTSIDTTLQRESEKAGVSTLQKGGLVQQESSAPEAGVNIEIPIEEDNLKSKIVKDVIIHASSIEIPPNLIKPAILTGSSNEPGMTSKMLKVSSMPQGLGEFSSAVEISQNQTEPVEVNTVLNNQNEGAIKVNTIVTTPSAASLLAANMRRNSVNAIIDQQQLALPEHVENNETCFEMIDPPAMLETPRDGIASHVSAAIPKYTPDAGNATEIISPIPQDVVVPGLSAGLHSTIAIDQDPMVHTKFVSLCIVQYPIPGN